ncbi:MAG: flavin reductase family protein [Rhodospirillales bacterium]|jgi:flavin reductase (DIM6/NTAB) family NADH-FMN oxidoreductase RutF|nr:flavin reductase family protein [Rhodospirillales bacterium]MDK9720283.1 flavin reductase family protein [Rhodospirillales bacterium]
MVIDSRSFRKALGCFATGVTVIAANDGQGKPVGVTISSFASLSLEPPLVLFCLGLGASYVETFRKASHFAVNVLRDDQKELSIRFASRMADKWAEVEHSPGAASGAPVISHCLAVLECQLEKEMVEGDHVILIGRVLGLDYDPGGQPLLYFRGNYAEMA